MCSHCGCEAIDVVGRFMAEHVEVVNACGDLRRAVATREPRRVATTADALRRLLYPHTVAEETGLFAVLAEDPEFADPVARLCREHEDLDRLLDQVAAGGYETFPAFERALRAHIDREENGLFPAAAVRFAGPEWERVDALTSARSPAHDHGHEHDGDHHHGHDHAHPHAHAHPH